MSWIIGKYTLLTSSWKGWEGQVRASVHAVDIAFRLFIITHILTEVDQPDIKAYKLRLHTNPDYLENGT